MEWHICVCGIAHISSIMGKSTLSQSISLSLMSSRLCSHCSLNETILADFDCSVEELETLNADKKFARALKQSETGRDWHYYHMRRSMMSILKRAQRIMPKIRRDTRESIWSSAKALRHKRHITARLATQTVRIYMK